LQISSAQFSIVFLLNLCLFPTDVVVADAIVKDVPGFDLQLAKEALIKDVRQLL